MPDIIIKLPLYGGILISYSGAITSTLTIESGLQQGKDI